MLAGFAERGGDLRVDLKHGAFARHEQHLAARRALELLGDPVGPGKRPQFVVGDGVRQFRDLAHGNILAEQPAAHETRDSLAQLQCETMRRVGRGHVDRLRGTEARIETLRIAKHLPRAAEVEGRIACGRADQRGLRGAHDAVVRLVHAEGDLAEDVLLAVLRAQCLDEFTERGEVATRCRSDDAIVERHEIRGLRAAAAVAGAADLVGEDVLAALQVVDDSHAVPDAELRHIRPDQRAAEAGRRMLRGTHQPHVGMRHLHMRRIVEDGALPRRVEHLISLALPDGVVANRRHAVTGQQHADELILPRRLPLMTMPARHQHRGPRCRSLGEIKIGREMKRRPRLKDDLLHAIAFALQRARDLRIQRRPLRQPADAFEEQLSPLLLPIATSGGALEHLLKGRATLLGHRHELAREPPFKGPLRRHAIGRGLEHGEVFSTKRDRLGVERRSKGKNSRDEQHGKASKFDHEISRGTGS